MRFNVENPTRFATIAGNSLYFEGPAGLNGQSVIEQNGSAVARIQSNMVRLADSATMVVATEPGAGFTVGFAGEGNLDVLDGSTLTVGDLINTSPLENELVAGRESSGKGRVYVQSASLIATNAVLGNSGEGRLEATANASVQIQETLFVGYNNGAHGEGLVNHYSNLTAQNVQIGRQGVGSFSVLDGSGVSVAGTTFVAPLENSNGLLLIAGIDPSYQTGNLAVGGLTTGGVPLQGGEGRVEVLSNGSLVVDSELVLYDQGSMRLDSLGIVTVGGTGGVQGAANVNFGGKLAGTGRVEGNVIVNNQGILTPGLNGVGLLTIAGDLTFAATSQAAIFGWDLANAGSASVDAGGSSASALHDQLIIEGGSVTLNHVSIVLSEINGFAASFDATQSYSWKLMEIQGTGSLTTLGPFSILFNGSSEIKNAFDNQWGTLSLAVGNNGGSDRFLALSYTAVPEPSALGLIVGGILIGALRLSRDSTAVRFVDRQRRRGEERAGIGSYPSGVWYSGGECPGGVIVTLYRTK